MNDLRLEAVPAAVGQARRFVRQVLQDKANPLQNAPAELITSELLTNAVLHAPPPGPGSDSRRAELLLRVLVLGDCLRIEVQDASPGRPEMSQTVDPLAESGRGLHIVDALTAGRWGSTPTPDGGKVTWAELPLLYGREEPAMTPQACTCGHKAETLEEMEDHWGEVFIPDDDIALDGRIHAEASRDERAFDWHCLCGYTADVLPDLDAHLLAAFTPAGHTDRDGTHHAHADEE